VRIVVRSLIVLSSAVLLYTQPAHAEDSPLSSMAQVMLSLEGYPNAAEKAVLQVIVDSEASSDAEKMTAMCITNFEGELAAVDKAILSAIAADPETPRDLQTLATIAVDTVHMTHAVADVQLRAIVAGN